MSPMAQPVGWKEWQIASLLWPSELPFVSPAAANQQVMEGFCCFSTYCLILNITWHCKRSSWHSPEVSLTNSAHSSLAI